MQKGSREGVNIVLTGGHAATPAIAVVEKLKELHPHKLTFYWIGSKKAIEGSSTHTLEYKVFPVLGINFVAIVAGKIQTKLTIHTIPSILKIPIGFIQTFFALLSIRPRAILSFGGYASFPVVFWGWIFRIPIILHEQTVAAGRANIASSFFSTKIALSREESFNHFPKNKSVLIGNPLMQEIVGVGQKSKPGNPPTILIMGGSRGSEFINDEILKIIPDLVGKYNLIHITGESHYQKIKSFAKDGYEVLSSVAPFEMSKYYQKADLIIARSGANTVSEIIATKRPSILIPLPRTFMNEQVQNARYAENFGIAKVLLETEVTSKTLLSQIQNSFLNWHKIVEQVSKKVSPDINSAKNLANLISDYIE